MGKALSEMTMDELWELFPIILKEHNPVYFDWYSTEEKMLKKLLFQQIKRINHIGSTAVKGLVAKPTIDILLELERDCDIELIIGILTKDGWILASDEKKPEMKLVFNKGYTTEGFAEKVYHLHVRFFDDWKELYFRDYLSAHSDVARKYGELKISLLDKYKHDRDGYTAAKADFILQHTEKAKEEFKNKYAPTI